MKISIIGNCQAEIIREIIQSSTQEEFNLPNIKPVHLLSESDMSCVYEHVATSSVLVIQLIGDDYRGLKVGTNQLRRILPPESKCIVIPNLYWDGYYPSLTYLKDSSGQTVTTQTTEYGMFLSDYHDSIIVAGALLGLSIEKMVQFYQDADFLHEWVELNLSKSFIELTYREKYCDIMISDHIRSGYKFNQMFWTFNHPSNILLELLVREIFIKLGLFNVDIVVREKEFLDGFVFPLFDFVACGLGTVFLPKKFVCHGKEMKYESYISSCLSAYRILPELLICNSNNIKVANAIKYLQHHWS